MKNCIYLNGEWEFQERGQKEWKQGKVPGLVQLDLVSLKEMPEPYFRNNEGEFVKLEEKEWCYRKTFSVKDNFLENLMR